MLTRAWQHAYNVNANILMFGRFNEQIKIADAVGDVVRFADVQS